MSIKKQILAYKHLALGTPEREDQERVFDRPSPPLFSDEQILQEVIAAGGTQLVLDMIADPYAALGELYQLALDGEPDADIGLKLRGQVFRLARQKALEKS